MPIIENLSECQPRFQAYCNANGLTDGDTFNNYDYITWLGRMAAEFKRTLHKKHYDILTEEEHEQFTEWLTEEVSEYRTR